MKAMTSPPATLAKASTKGIYDRLVRSDLQTLVLPPESLDLVVCADVFVYVGGLERIVSMIAAALRPGGMFGFSVETSLTGDDLVLQPSRRYAHSRPYVSKTLAAAGFTLLSLDTAVIRQDRGVPIVGADRGGAKDIVTLSSRSGSSACADVFPNIQMGPGSHDPSIAPLIGDDSTLDAVHAAGGRASVARAWYGRNKVIEGCFGN